MKILFSLFLVFTSQFAIAAEGMCIPGHEYSSTELDKKLLAEGFVIDDKFLLPKNVIGIKYYRASDESYVYILLNENDLEKSKCLTAGRPE